MRDSTFVVPLVVGIVVVLALGVGLGVSPAAAQEADLSCVDGDDGGPIYETDSGLTVTEDTSGTTINEFVFPASDTVRFDFSSDDDGNGLNLQAGGGQARIDEGTGSRTCIGNADASSNDITIQPDNENEVTIDGSSIDISLRDVNYANSNDEVDIAYDADTLNSLTVSTAFGNGRQVRALDDSDDSELDSAKANTGGYVTFDSLPDDQAYDLDLRSVAPNFDVTIDSIDDSVTEGDTIAVEYTVENTGDNEGTQDVDVQVDGETEETQESVTLDFEETFQDTFEYDTEGSDVPDVDITIGSDDDTASDTVDVNAQPSGGGGGGGGEELEEGPQELEGEQIEETVDVPEDTEPEHAEQTEISFDQETGESTAEFTENSTVQEIEFEESVVGETTVVEYEDPPEETGDPPGEDISVTQIETSDAASDTESVITKRVPMEEVEDSGVDPEDLVITRFNEDEEWKVLDTELDEVTDEAAILEAENPGFSFFAVSAVSDPEASFAVAPADPVAGEELTLDASESTNAYGDIVAYEWTVDGEDLTGETVTVAVESAGEVEVELTVENDAGRTSSTQESVPVGEADSEDTDGTDGESAGDDDGTGEQEDTGDDGTGEQEDTGNEGTETDGGDDPGAFGPGFGITATLLALLVTGLLALRRS